MIKRTLPIFILLSVFILTGCAMIKRHNLPGEKEDTARESGSPILIATEVLGPDSSGGYTIRYVQRNLSDETIKYISFKAVFENRVGDEVSCEYGYTGGALRVTGPLEPGETTSGGPGSKAYGCQIDKVHIDEVTIVFMDDSTVTFERSALADMNSVIQWP